MLALHDLPIPPLLEATAFLEALEASDPTALTACVGWTVHDLTAHLVAGAVEVATVLESVATGGPVPATREMAERELSYRRMAAQDLRQLLPGQLDRVQRLIADLLARDPDHQVPWTGRRMSVSALLIHARSELALHRWDLVGDDHLSGELLAQPELTAHAVTALGPALLARGTSGWQPDRAATRLALRAPGRDQVVLEVHDGLPALRLEPDVDGPSLCGDPAARLLLLWGRRPADPRRLRSTLTAEDFAAVSALLRGY